MTDRTLRESCDALAGWVGGAAPPTSHWSQEHWDRCREASFVHGVSALLYPVVTSTGQWPAAEHAWFEFQYENNRARVARLRGELQSILAAFEAAGVRAMPLKGIALADRLYARPGARPMNDIDLLVPEDQHAACVRVLSTLGYEQGFAGWKHVKFHRPDNRTVVDVTCEHPDNPRPLEVHPRCVEQIREVRVDLTGAVWAGATRGAVAERPTWEMTTDVLWIYLLTHATHHMLLNNFRLIQLVDLLLLRDELDGPVESLSAFDARASVAPLELLERHFPHPVSAAMLRAQRERVSAGFRGWAASIDLYEVSDLNPVPWRS